jgi:hypothetical protein
VSAALAAPREVTASVTLGIITPTIPSEVRDVLQRVAADFDPHFLMANILEFPG